MRMNSKLYDVLKWIAQILLPALTVFVGVVLGCFEYEHVDIVVTIMTAFDTFLGTILGISSYNYRKDAEFNE